MSEPPLKPLPQSPQVPAPARAVKPAAKDRLIEPIEELDVLIRARYPIIYVISWEEERVEQCLRKIAEKRNKQLFVWTITQGILKSGTPPQRAKSGGDSTADPLAALDAVINQVDPAIYLFKDFHHFMEDERCNLSVIRRMRDVSYHLRDTYKTIIIVSPIMSIAPELAKDVTLVEFGLPRPKELNLLLERIIEDVKDNPNVHIDLPPDDRERLLHAARGLTLKEAENVFAKTLVLATLHTPDSIQTIQRIFSVFPPEQQNAIITQLANSLQAIIAQKLLPRADGKGRVLACEICIATPAVRHLIREHKLHQLYTEMQTNRKLQMQTMDSALLELYQEGEITYDMALSHAREPDVIRHATGESSSEE
jgi:hypothetical protein